MKHRHLSTALGGVRGLLSVGVLSLLWACTPSEPRDPSAHVTFVRGGIAVDGMLGQVEVKKEGERLSTRRLNLDGKRQLLLFDWEPGQPYQLYLGGQEQTQVAPQKPTPYRIRTVALEGDAVAASSAIPDVSLRFSTDGRRLAVGTLFGELRVIDVLQGTTLLKKQVTEGMVKRVAFSPDGETVYAGEQSPDGFLYALDVRTGAERWRRRLADDLETSRPAAAGDRYGIYFLPGVFELQVLQDGRVVAAGTHSWNVDGVQKNRSRLYVLQPDGSPDFLYPAGGALDGNLVTFDVDPAGQRLVFAFSRSAQEPTRAREGIPVLSPGVYALDLVEKKPTWQKVFEPLTPHFKEVFIWEGLALSPDGTRCLVGLGDGRVALLDATVPGPTPSVLLEQALGAPLEVGGVPITTPVSYAHASPLGLYAQTNNSNIPFGTEATSRTPPAPHPAARTLFAWTPQGQEAWRFRGDFTPSGVFSSADGRWLMMTTANPSAEERTDRHGLVLLDATPGLSAEQRLVFSYATEGPVFFHADVSADGHWLAIAETPARKTDGRTVYGQWQLHVVH